MAESSLSLTKSDLEIEVAKHAGFSIDSADWNDTERERVDSAVRDGVAMVYFNAASYEWSWLKPLANLTLESGATTVDLPDDFNWLQGDIIPASAAGEAQFRIRRVDDDEIIEQQALSSTRTGRPTMFCVRSIKGTSAVESNRAQLVIFPIADQAYTLQVRYAILPNAVSDSRPYVYGGAAHSQTFKAAVKAAYEMTWQTDQGQKMTLFKDMLAMSIAEDRKRKTRNMGYNADRSDDIVSDGRHTSWLPISVNGITPGVA